VSDVSEGEAGRASALRQQHAARRAENSTTSLGNSAEANLTELLDFAVPAFCDWCEIDLVTPTGGLAVFGVRNADCTHESAEVEVRDCCSQAMSTRVPDLSQITMRVLDEGHTEKWSAHDGELPCCAVIAMRVNDQVFATVAFVVNEKRAGFGLSEIEAAQDVVWATATAIERLQLLQNAREAVRHTQRVASQLHQLIAASITVAGLHSEQEVLMSLASSTRGVFDADIAVVTLENGPSAPLCGQARRGQKPECLTPGEEGSEQEIPHSVAGSSTPWREKGWLVAPILERRDLARGVVAIRRKSSSLFGAEDQEVLTLLAQMASTALGAVQLSRTIQHSETRWRILVETAPIGIVEIEGESSVCWWNRGAARIFAWPEFDESSRSDQVIFPQTIIGGLDTLWADVRSGRFASGRDLGDVEIRGRRRDLTASAVLLPSVEGNARSILALIDDVTNHRELKSELRHAHQMEIRGQVASSVAHDFNNLLTLISGYAEILSSGGGLDDRAAQMVQEIQTTASRASTLTEQLQSIGRTKAPEPVVLSPESAISSIGEVLERIVGGDIEVVWSFAKDVGNVRVDADQFEQMVLNLALNARDAMPDGGELSISVTSHAIHGEQAHLLNVASGHYVHISVADTGMGMDEATRERCFEPLFTTKGPFEGTGLGLAAARRLVEESGGSIEVLSEVGRGTTFDVYLPVVDEQSTMEPTLAQLTPTHRPATILLAEDDDGLRRLVVQTLERNDYLVLEANSGELALELARDFDGTIDLLLSDVEMALISGSDLALALQAANPQLGVVLMSGTAGEAVLDGLLPNTSAFIAKPFRPSTLVEQVQSLLAQRDALATKASPKG
jgi:signal transduction histidine kinase/ActR/RegA family two-component response regulator